MKLLPGIVVAICILFSCNASKPKPLAISHLHVAKLNKLVYNDSIPILLMRENLPYQPVFALEADKPNYAVLFKHNEQPLYILTIRGTDLEFNANGIANVVQDFNIFNQRDWPYADTSQKAVVAAGAYQGYKNVISELDLESGVDLIAYLKANMKKESTLIISGHSLGGNIANLVASHIKSMREIKANVELITFGAPASGNAGFVKDLEMKFPTGSRYEIDLDLASKFHNLRDVQQTLNQFGLDSATTLGAFKIGESTSSISVGSLLTLVEDVATSTGILDEKRKYVQSEKHLKSLVADKSTIEKQITVDAVLNNAFRFHRIDAYIAMLSGKK